MANHLSMGGGGDPELRVEAVDELVVQSLRLHLLVVGVGRPALLERSVTAGLLERSSSFGFDQASSWGRAGAPPRRAWRSA